MGEIPRRAVLRGKPVVYEGTVEARSQGELDTFHDALEKAFAVTAERQMVISPRPPFAGGPYFYTARVTALDIPEEHPEVEALRRQTLGYERQFTLGLRLSDPRFYASVLKTYQTALLVPSSGLSLPWTLPVSLPAPGDSSASVTAINTGTAPVDPIVDLYGPGRALGIANDTIGVQLRTKSTLQVAQGQFVRVNFRDRTLLLNGVDDVRSQLDRESTTWWDDPMNGIISGSNVMRFIGENISDPAHAEITINDGLWG